MATVTNGTSTVPVEIVAARLRRPLRRESIGLLNVAAPQIQAGTPALLAGQLTYLCNSLSDVLALDALYGGLSPITLAGSPVEQRRQLTVNPLAAASAATGNVFKFGPQWFGTGGTGTTTNITGAADGPTLPDGSKLTQYRRKTWTTAPTAAAAVGWQWHIATGTSAVAVTPGKTYTVSLYWRASFSAAVIVHRFQAQFWDAAGATVTTLTSPALGVPASGTWQRASWTFTVPAGAAFAGPVHYLDAPVASVPVGATVDATGPLAEATDQLLDYLDGAYSPTVGLTAAWTGVANESASILTRPDLEAGLNGFKHAAIGATEMVAERALPGRPSKWLYSVDVVEVP